MTASPDGCVLQSVVLTALVFAAACAPEPEVVDGFEEVEIAGLTQAWRAVSLPAVADVEFLDGELYIASGEADPLLSRMVLDRRPIVQSRRMVLPEPGRPRRLETNGRLLYLSGEWGRDIFALDRDGQLFGAPRTVSGVREFIPWDTGEFLVVGSPMRPAVLLEASVPGSRGEGRRGWGMLPTVADGSLVRGDAEPWATVSIDRDPFQQVHALVTSAGALVQFDRLGEATLVRFLPEDLRDVGTRAALRGYGASVEPSMNGVEVSCEGHVWISAGHDAQRVAVLDPRTYRVVRRLSFGVPGLIRARWSSCGDWVVGWSDRTGALVVGRADVPPAGAPDGRPVAPRLSPSAPPPVAPVPPASSTPS